VARSPFNYIGGRTGITIAKIADDADYIRLDNIAAQNINDDTIDPVSWDNQLELDTGSFAHDTAVDNSQITVLADDDYLFLSDLYVTNDGVQRGMTDQQWRENGATVLPYGDTGRYSRNSGGADAFGNWTGALVDLSAGDFIETTSLRIGNSGTNNADVTGLQGVRLSSLFVTLDELIWDGTDNSWDTNHWSGVTPAGGEIYTINGGFVTVDTDPVAGNRLTINGGGATVNATRTLQFTGSGGVTTGAGGTLTLAPETAGGAGDGGTLMTPVFNAGGTHSIGAGSTLVVTSNLLVDSILNTTGATLNVTGAGITVNGAGILTVDNPLNPSSVNVSGMMNTAALSAAGAITVNAGGTLTSSGLIGATNVTANGILNANAGATLTGTLDIGGAFTAGGEVTAPTLNMNTGGSVTPGANTFNVATALNLVGSDLNMTGGTLNTAGATVTIGGGRTLTVDNQTLLAATLELQGTLVRTGASQDVTVTNTLNVAGADLNMTGGTLNTAGATVTVGGGRTLTVHNQTLLAATLDLQGTLARTGGNQDVTVTNSLNIAGSNLDMALGTLTTTGANITVAATRSLATLSQTLAGNNLIANGDVDVNLGGLNFTGDVTVGTDGSLFVRSGGTIGGTLNVAGGLLNSGALGVTNLTVSDRMTQGVNMTTVSNRMTLGANIYQATSGNFGVRGTVTSVKPDVLVLNGDVTVTGKAADPVGHPTAGLVGAWTFDDGKATDFSGNGHDGTLIGSPTIDATDLFDPGAGMSLNTNGGNNAVLIGGNEADFDTGGALTVVAWVKERPDGNWEPYISKRGESGQGWQVRRRSSSSNLTFTLRGTSGTDDPQGSFSLGDNGGNAGWIHVVSRYDGVRRQVIVNGDTVNLDIDIADTGNIANTGSSVVFGARDNSGNAGNAANLGNWSHVKLDDIFIYDRALTDEEIATIYNGGVALPRGAAPTVLVGGLAGNGTIDASATGGIEIDAGGLVSPGASTGQLDVIGDLILGEAFSLDWEYENGAADRDLTTVTGELTLPVDAIVNVINLGGGTLQEFEILFSFGTVSGDPSAWIVNGAPAGSNVLIQGNNVVLAAIPEPTSAVLALLGLIGLAGSRLRRRRSRG
jgi:hypothetical protein